MTARALLIAALALTACVGDPPEAQLSDAQARQLAASQVEAVPAKTVRLDARFGDVVTLVGYRLEPYTLRHHRGDALKLTLVWQPDGPIPRGWRVYSHLTDAGGKMLKNLDAAGPLRSQAGVSGVPWPPSRWQPERYILDTLSLTLPQDAPDAVQLRVGLYRGGERMAARGGAVEGHSAIIKLSVSDAPAAAPSKPAREAAVPELQLPRLPAGATIRVDGELDEPAWQSAATTGAFVSPADGKPSPRSPVQGSARLLWDDEHLYIAFVVRDRDVRGGFDDSVIDPHLWTRDTVEIMVDPDGDGDNRDYYEIQINPQNLVFDSRFDGYNLPRGGPDGPFGHQEWRADMQHAVGIDGSLDGGGPDQGYRVEAAIAWSSFDKARRSPPKPGDRWRMNFYAMQDNGGVSWSPILGRGNFHRASRFGRVVFSP